MPDLPTEIIVVLEPPPPEVAVTVTDEPDVQVTVTEVGLVGPAGPAGTAGSTDTSIADALEAHKNDLRPHPVYDDAPSFALLIQNGLV